MPLIIIFKRYLNQELKKRLREKDYKKMGHDFSIYE